MTIKSTPHWAALRGSPAALATAATATILLLAAIVIGQTSTVGFLILGAAFVLVLAAAAWPWPRVVLVIAVLSPILDRYIISGLLPANLGTAAHLSSEVLLGAVALVVAIRGAREGTLIPALRHPTVYALAAFVAVALVGTAVNGVPLIVSGAGLAFTLDAAIIFVAVRIVGYDLRQASASVIAFVVLVSVAALVGLAQALLDPNLFGLYALQGRFGEVYRLSSFLGDPNTFGAFLIVAAPFAVFAAVAARTPRWRAIALVLALLLLVALWISFSRGAWLALVIGAGLASAVIDRRTLVTGAVLTAMAFAIALTMPRDLLVPAPDAGAGPQQRPDLIDSTFNRVGAVGEGRDLRTQFILNALPILRDHPVVGVGPGRYGGAAADIFPTPVYETYDTDRLFSNPLQRTVDNFWLHIAVEGGALGLAALGGAILAAFLPALWAARRAIGRRRILLGGIAAAVAGLVVNSVSTMTLEGNGVGYVFWFLLGLGPLVANAATGGSAGEQDGQETQQA
ncbi:MAG: O-antigen ligase family protein [Chloroflexota bacterium]